MNIFKFWKTLLTYGFAPLYFGGGSSSDNSQKSTTETQDNSIVAAPDSTSLSLNRSSVNDINIMTTDHGAVDGAFSFAKQVSANSTTLVQHALGSVQESEATALQAVQDTNKKALATVADAYTTAKAGEQKILVGAVVGLLGMVAIKVLK